MLLSSPDTGEPQALINASALTEIRTAAASVVATRLLARPDASDLAIIGTGVQARAHAIALAQDYAARGRPLAGIRIAGRTPGRAAQAAAGAQRRGRGARDGLRVRGRGRDRRRHRGHRHLLGHPRAGTGLAGGGHPYQRGGCVPAARSGNSTPPPWPRPPCSPTAGNRRWPKRVTCGWPSRSRSIPPVHIRGEIGELLSGTALGRVTGDREITVFESLGLAAEDLAAAQGVYRNAAQAGAGTWVDF